MDDNGFPTDTSGNGTSVSTPISKFMSTSDSNLLNLYLDNGGSMINNSNGDNNHDPFAHPHHISKQPSTFSLSQAILQLNNETSSFMNDNTNSNASPSIHFANHNDLNSKENDDHLHQHLHHHHQHNNQVFNNNNDMVVDDNLHQQQQQHHQYITGLHDGVKKDLNESTGTLIKTMTSQLNQVISQQQQQQSFGDDHQLQQNNDSSPLLTTATYRIPSPPPLPTHLTYNNPFINSALHSGDSNNNNNGNDTTGITQQIIQQQKNLRPTVERGQEAKKKDALAFLSFYFRVIPNINVPGVSRTSVLALYTHKVDIDMRYRPPNDMANLCGAVYTFIYQKLDQKTIKEYINMAENEKVSIDNTKRRKRKKNHDITNSEDVSLHDAFLTCIKYSSLLPFLEFINVDNLPGSNDHYTISHPDYLYTKEDLIKWEVELKDSKSTQSRSRTIVNLGELNNNNNNNNNQFSLNSSLNNLNNNLINNNNNNNLLQNNLMTNTNNLNNLNSLSNINNLNNNSNSINLFGLTSKPQRINLPVNITETVDSFIIYAFIPFYKPNQLKITVNQMDIILEGTISLPDSIQIPNGAEILVPNTSGHIRTQNDIQEGNFYKVIKLSAPIASSTVGKRDGVIVVIAKKLDDRQATVHQL